MEDIEQELEYAGNLISFDMEQTAKECASARSSNMVLLGAASPFITLDSEKIEDAIRSVFGAKGGAIVEANISAYRAGREKSRIIVDEKSLI